MSLSFCPWQASPAQSIMVVGKARSLTQVGEPKNCFTQVGSILTRKHQTKLERIARDKHSSLLQKFVYFATESLAKRQISQNVYPLPFFFAQSMFAGLADKEEHTTVTHTQNKFSELLTYFDKPKNVGEKHSNLFCCRIIKRHISQNVYLVPFFLAKSM